MHQSDTAVRAFAKRLYALRKERNLTQEALATKAGLDPSFISALEQSAKTPSLTSIERLANGLSVRICDLVNFGDRSRDGDARQKEMTLLMGRIENLDLKELKRIRKIVDASLD